MRHLTRSFIALLGVVVLAACEPAVQNQPQAIDTEALGYAAEGMEAVDRYVVAKSTHSMLVKVGGETLYQYGPQDELSYVASVRKSVLAMLYGPYVADGTIDLDATLEEIGIDDVGGLMPIERTATIRDLITARSGIYHPASNGGDSSADAPPRGSQEPGTYFLYNNWDFNAAGAIFEKLTGKSIFAELERQIAIPTGMKDIDLALNEARREGYSQEYSLYPPYHMFFSTRDLIKVGEIMLNEGSWEGQQLFDPTWIAEISSTVTPLEEMNPARTREGHFGYGYMWWIYDEATHGPEYKGAYAARGHFGHYIVVLPALDMVISHKTWPISYSSPEEYADINVTWDEMQKIIDRILEARMSG